MKDKPALEEKNSLAIYHDIRRLIEEARQNVAITVNIGLTMLYWNIGKKIRLDVLKGERANYGDEVLTTISSKLVPEYGEGFNEKNIRRMVQFYNLFPLEQIVVTLSRQLSWSHFGPKHCQKNYWKKSFMKQYAWRGCD